MDYNTVHDIYTRMMEDDTRMIYHMRYIYNKTEYKNILVLGYTSIYIYIRRSSKSN